MVSNVDLDLTGQSPSLPQFENQVVQCVTGEVRIEADDEGKKSLIIPLVFQEGATAVDGRQVPAGFSGCTVQIGLFEVGKRTKEMIQRDVLRFQCAVLRIKQGKQFVAEETSGKPIGVSFSRRQDTKDATRFFQDYKFMEAK